MGYDPAQFTTFISDGTVETFDVYKMIVTGFSNVWCSAFYILAVLMLFSHLRHGVQSIFQTVKRYSITSSKRRNIALSIESMAFVAAIMKLSDESRSNN